MILVIGAGGSFIGAPALIWLFHLDNIQRLLAGTERTIDQRT